MIFKLEGFMITSKLDVGPAPEFLMTLGAISIYHGAVISLTSPNGSMRTTSSSHLSFLHFIREIAQRIQAFSWIPDIATDWNEGELIGMSFKSSAGNVFVQYKIHPQLSHDKRTLLARWFRSGITELAASDH